MAFRNIFNPCLQTSKKFSRCYFQQRIRYQSTAPNLLCEHLKKRALIKLAGLDALTFLQGLVTNDVRHLTNDQETSVTLPCLFTMLLNQQGRVMYDGIIYNNSDKSNNDVFLLECDSSVVDDLVKHLKLYRIRKKIDIIPASTELSVWSVFSYSNSDSEDYIHQTIDSNSLPRQFDRFKPTILVEDPRHAGLGYRLILPTNSEVGSNFLSKDETVSIYNKLRYKLGIGEGIKDHPPTKCFPLECNLDYLHGVSFHKGCYIGQELTARTHHTGVVRKRLMPVRLPAGDENIPDNCVILNEKNENVGKFRNREGTYGLALLRIEECLSSKKLVLKGSEIELTTSKPFWWPQEATRN